MERFEVGKRITELREKKGLKKNALAKLAGVSPTYISQLERGEKRPTVDYLGYICFGLGVTLSEFFRAGKEYDDLYSAIDKLSATQKRALIAFLKCL